MQNRSSFSRECVQTWWMCFEMNFILVFFCTNLLSEYPNSFQSKPRRVIGISSVKGPHSIVSENQRRSKKENKEENCSNDTKKSMQNGIFLRISKCKKML